MELAPAEKIELLVLDVDGVLTDGGIILDARGTESKRFNVRDGLGIRLWMKLGYDVAIITGRAGMALEHRARELGIKHVFQKAGPKVEVFGRVLGDLGLKASQAAVIGDDLPDMPMLRLAGYAMAVADATREVQEIADYVTVRPGGAGAVREAIEHLLKAKDRWQEALADFD